MLLDQGRLVCSLMTLVLLRDVLCLSQCMHIPSAQVTTHPQEAHPVTPHTISVYHLITSHHLIPISDSLPKCSQYFISIKITGREFIE